MALVQNFSGFGTSDVRARPRLIIRQVVTLLNDLRKMALIAGVAMAVAALWSFGQLVMMAVVRGGMSLPQSAAVALSFLLLEAPLPVFLLIFSRSGITPSVSRRLRNRVLVLALISGLDLVFTGLREWRGRGSGSLIESAVSGAITLLSIVAFMLFLIALSRQTGGGRDFEEGRRRLVRTAALIAAGSRAGFLLMEFAAQVWIYSMHLAHNVTSVQGMLRTALFALPGLAAPLIVYVCIGPASIGTPREAIAAEDGAAHISATA